MNETGEAKARRARRRAIAHAADSGTFRTPPDFMEAAA
jgi:hypothetical protein